MEASCNEGAVQLASTAASAQLLAHPAGLLVQVQHSARALLVQVHVLLIKRLRLGRWVARCVR